MDIHAPEGPVHTFKDFLVHISIVTLGILIALGLDGLRETLHNRHLVRETRENVHTEMHYMATQAGRECTRVGEYSKVLNRLVAAMPQLQTEHYDEALRMLNSDQNPGYFLSAQSFQVALSTGVLAHLPTPEISAYAYAADAVKNYTALQTRAIQAEAAAKAYVQAHPHPTPDQLSQELETVMLFADAERGVASVCPQMEQNLEGALAASGAK